MHVGLCLRICKIYKKNNPKGVKDLQPIGVSKRRKLMAEAHHPRRRSEWRLFPMVFFIFLVVWLMC